MEQHISLLWLVSQLKYYGPYTEVSISSPLIACLTMGSVCTKIEKQFLIIHSSVSYLKVSFTHIGVLATFAIVRRPCVSA